MEGPIEIPPEPLPRHGTLFGRIPQTPGLCRWCRKPVPKPRRTFCSGGGRRLSRFNPNGKDWGCVEEWQIRTSGRALRLAVAFRDDGVCARCGIDCEALEEKVRAINAAREPRDLERLQELFKAGFRPPWWEVDHIVPVAEGGGMAGLEGVRTLCIPCHLIETAALRKRLAARRTP